MDLRLWEMCRRKFRPGRLRTADALVAFVPDVGEVPAAVDRALHVPADQRWFPADGGHLVKWRHRGELFDGASFQLEPGGWDHEHCSVCNGTIKAREDCWVSKRGQFILLCKRCHGRLEELCRA
jgi:hypothetical protein